MNIYDLKFPNLEFQCLFESFGGINGLQIWKGENHIFVCKPLKTTFKEKNKR